MRLYLLLSLTCVSVIMTACMPRMIVSERQENPETGSVQEMTVEQSGSGTDVYNFTLRAGRRELSGIIAARQVDGGGVRAVASTWFGLSLFDMTIYGDSYRMNSCAGFLDNEKLASFVAAKLRKRLL